MLGGPPLDPCRYLRDKRPERQHGSVGIYRGTVDLVCRMSTNDVIHSVTRMSSTITSTDMVGFPYRIAVEQRPLRTVP